jgi:peptidylprolyl isomerase
MKHVLRGVASVAALATVLALGSCASQTPGAGDQPADTSDAAAAEVPDTETPDTEVPDTESPAETAVPRASGEPVTPEAGLPAVTLDDVGAPSIEPVAGDPPTGLVVQTLIKGPGEPVAEGAEITAQYAGWLWDGSPFDSSWSRGGEPFTAALAQGSLIDGWVQGLAGQTVGSQVLLIIPPELAYGDQDNGTIPANSTLVFVVDILAAS